MLQIFSFKKTVAVKQKTYPKILILRRKPIKYWNKNLKKNLKRTLYRKKFPIKYKKKTNWRYLRRIEKEKKLAQEIREEKSGMIEKVLFPEYLYEQRNTLRKTNTFHKKWLKSLIFESYWVNKFINKHMYKGEKVKAEKIFWNLLKKLKVVTNRLPFLVLIDIFFTLKPILTMLSKRVGVRVYKVPIQLAEYQSIKLVMKWFIQETRLFFNRTEKRRQKEENKIKAAEKPAIGIRSKKQRRLARRLQKKRKKKKKIKNKVIKTTLYLKRVARYKTRQIPYSIRLYEHFLSVLEGAKSSVILKKKILFQKLLYDNQLYLNYRWVYTQ